MKYQVWWKQLHWPEYVSELLGIAFLIFVGLSAIIIGFGTNSPLARMLPDSNARRLITGMIFAGCGPLVAISPLGKLSGGHLNPAVSVGFWIQGKMHRLDLVGYIVGQFLGAVLGA